MIKLDYGTQLSDDPIKLSIGTLRKPTLKDISALTFSQFDLFQMYLKLDVQEYFEYFAKDEDRIYYDALPEKEKLEYGLFDIVVSNERLLQVYLIILNFFFEESVFYKDGLFLLAKDGVTFAELNTENVCGCFGKESFQQVIDLIQQVCCIYEEPESEMKFKNSTAKKLFQKMKMAEKKKKKTKASLDFTLPNMISAVCSMHPSLNFTNIWGLTVFQLRDVFNRLINKTVYDIDSRRVSVWGDEKKKFDSALWYKNEFDKN